MPSHTALVDRPAAPLELRVLTRADAHWHRDELAVLLSGGVATGASLGLLAPLLLDAARADWDALQADLSDANLLWIVRAGDAVVGCVRLAHDLRPAGRHRASVERLLVHPGWRRRGVASLLLAEVESHAVAQARTLLLADVEAGSIAAQVLARRGWRLAGVVPGDLAAPDGSLRDGARMFRILPAPTSRA